MHSAELQTVLITGGSNGLGFYCAQELAAATPPWHVVITSPDADRAETAAAALSTATGNPNVYGMALELSSFNVIRDYVSSFPTKHYPPLRAVVFNAGIQVPQLGARTQDGIERIFGVNYLGHFLLATLLVHHVIAPARLVFVSSTHDPAKKAGISAPPYTTAHDLAHPPFFGKGDPLPKNAAGLAYASSKLCNILGAYELDRRLQKTGLSTTGKPITVNCFDPGLMPGTALARDQSRTLRFLWHYVLPLVGYVVPFMHTPAQSGRALARLIVDPALKTVTGKYFAGMKEEASSAESYDEDKAADLWHTSVALTGLTRQESPLIDS